LAHRERVLVAVMNRPRDFEIARDQGWYRVPEKRATPGVFFYYRAFYFTGAFGELKWAVHYYARCLGHELLTRRDLLPDEPDHPRAGEPYFKIALGPLQRREPPIVSRRWRRVAFIHTTWDRFQAAEEINDLFVEGGEFVDRLYHTLREEGLMPERCYPVREAGAEYLLAVPCRDGVVGIEVTDDQAVVLHPEAVTVDPATCLGLIRAEVDRCGGVAPVGKEIKVTVKLGAPLSQVIGASQVILIMPEGTTIAEVLDELQARYPRFEAGLKGEGLPNVLSGVLYALFLNARPVRFEHASATLLRDGDRLYLFLPVAGG
jgi:molybdopterin converting factor small subunit